MAPMGLRMMVKGWMTPVDSVISVFGQGLYTGSSVVA